MNRNHLTYVEAVAKRFEVFHRELREGFGKERCSCLTTDGDWIIVNQVID